MFSIRVAIAAVICAKYSFRSVKDHAQTFQRYCFEVNRKLTQINFTIRFLHERIIPAIFMKHIRQLLILLRE